MDGFDLKSFRKNPIALYGHEHDKIIGVWENVRIEGKRLLGRLKLAKEGTSPFVDYVRALIDQRILKAVSVGFQPIEATPRKSGGMDFTKASLHEVSLVAVPANPNAMAIAKALAPEYVDILFAQPSSKGDDLAGQSTDFKTPNLDAVRKQLKEKGIDY
jgi:HK97 family phage prohead protease